MTQKSREKRIARLRQKEHGGKYTNHLTQARLVKDDAEDKSMLDTRKFEGRPMMLNQIEQGLSYLFDRRPPGSTFVARVNSYEHVDDRVGPNGEVSMVPIANVTFSNVPASDHWVFSGALWFIVGELYDGSKPVKAEIIHGERGKERLRDIIRQKLRADHDSLDNCLVDLQVTDALPHGERQENLIVVVTMTFRMPPRTLPQLLALVGVDSSFGVEIGRQPIVAHSADYQTAARQLRELQRHAQWFMRTPHAEYLIAEPEFETLRRDGAAEVQRVQVLRSFLVDGQETSVTVRCRSCERYIVTGRKVREGACICGQVYRVLFDLPNYLHLDQRTETLCMDCGASMRAREWVGDRQPWSVVNEGQVRCYACKVKQAAS